MTNKLSNSISCHTFAPHTIPPMPSNATIATTNIGDADHFRYATIAAPQITSKLLAILFALFSCFSYALHCRIRLPFASCGFWLFGALPLPFFSCLDYIEIFPFLREPVIEDTSNPEYVICNRTAITSTNVSAFASTTTSTMLLVNNGTVAMKLKQPTSTSTTTTSTVKQQHKTIANANTTVAAQLVANNKQTKHTTVSSVANYKYLSVIDANNSFGSDARDLRANEFIYSAGKILGIRVRFKRQQQQHVGNALHAGGDDALQNWLLNITGEYRFLKKEYFKNDGRLIPGTYCDYYFFADANEKPESFDMWKYFHSPRFPAQYPAHIKCAYKFIGRPETRVEIVFEEIKLPKTGKSCSIDKLTVFDSESANMNAVIDVICDALQSRRIISSGPDLLIEFNASSNITSKGFRGKFKFTHNEVDEQFVPPLNVDVATDKIMALERIGIQKVAQYPVLTVDEWDNFFKSKVCGNQKFQNPRQCK